MNTKKIKTTLINPPSFLKSRYGDLGSFGPTTEPLGLAYLAANLEKHGYSVSIIDSLASGLTISQIIEIVKKDEPDLIGLTALTPMYEAVKELSSALKRELPLAKIIIGGAHATALPKDTLLDIKEANYICVGEGENTIVDLADCLSGEKSISQVDGLVYRDENNQIIFNKPRQFEMNLDKFPSPARHLLPMNDYRLTVSRTKGTNYCPTLIVARGCPFKCSFCSHPFGRTFRHHSVERIISELDRLDSQYQINQVNFEADTLTASKDFILSLCQALIDRGFNRRIKWTCESRVSAVDETVLRAMKEAGCWQISYGVESGTQRLLDLINKGATLQQIRDIFAITKKIGISIRAFFILGLPTETIEETWKTINFAKELDPLWAQIAITVPYPGTPLFEQLKAENKIRHFNWSDYNTWGGWSEKKIPFVCEGRSAEDIKKIQKQALIAFYLRPKPLLRFLRQIDSFKTFKRYFLGFLVLVKHKIKIILIDNKIIYG